MLGRSGTPHVLANSAPNGADLRRRWDVLCEDTVALVDARAHRARLSGDEVLMKYLERQSAAVRSLKWAADGRRNVPGKIGTGILHDAPEEIAGPAYKDVLRALDNLNDFWFTGMGVSGWDWVAQGYPPGWGNRLQDRLRAGLFYRGH